MIKYSVVEKDVVRKSDRGEARKQVSNVEVLSEKEQKRKDPFRDYEHAE